MPIYDYECAACGHVHERIEHMNDQLSKKCPSCDLVQAKRIISASGVWLGNDESAPWIKSVLEVVDKDSKAPHVQNFIKDPTRRNYRAWMKGEGLRHREPGEKSKPPPTKTDRLGQLLWQRHRKRKRIEIG